MKYRKLIFGTFLLLGAFTSCALLFLPGVLNSSPGSRPAQSPSDEEPRANASFGSTRSAPATAPKQHTAASAAHAKASPETALAQLQAAAPTQLQTARSRQTGHYDFVRAPSGEVMVRDNTSAKPEARALAFLANYGASSA